MDPGLQRTYLASLILGILVQSLTELMVRPNVDLEFLPHFLPTKALDGTELTSHCGVQHNYIDLYSLCLETVPELIDALRVGKLAGPALEDGSRTLVLLLELLCRRANLGLLSTHDYDLLCTSFAECTSNREADAAATAGDENSLAGLGQGWLGGRDGRI